ncbi:hypothetical protein BGZ79_003220 [Entomortierella chlamydospora]|nr:hypothetical protein BGZ79_003220 [Entomortierella chlamydospora]
MPSTSNPLDLPEIRLHIGIFLKKQDLVQCLRVSRTWYNTYLPLVWRELKIGYYHRSNDTSIRPSTEDIQRYRKWVNYLWIGTLPPGQYAFHYPNLRTLFLRQVEGRSVNKPELCPQQLIRFNATTLTSLELHGQNEYYTSKFWNAVGELPNLKSLYLEGSTIRKDQSSDFWRACLNLESLRLSSTSISLVDDFGSLNLTFPKLYRLSIIFVGGQIGWEQLELIKRCPRLEELRWKLGEWYSSAELQGAFTRLAIGKAWPRLKRLGLSDGCIRVKDEVLADILDALPRVTMLEVGFTRFGVLGFQVLRRHFGIISILDVTECPAFSRAMFKEVLYSCPCLEEFSGGGILVRDIAESGPWVCLRLQRLHIQFAADPMDTNLNEKVFEKLSRLVRLEELSIGIDHLRGTKYLDFRVANGLGALSSLTRLRSFRIQGLTRKFGECDLIWMLTHWWNLNRFEGLPIQIESGVRDKMVKLLKSHGLSTGLSP